MSGYLVSGFDQFKAHLSPYKDRFIIIGGTALTLLEDDGIARDNYKKHRRDVFMLLAGLPGLVAPVPVPEKIKSDLAQFAVEHAAGTPALDAVAQSIDAPPDLAEMYIESFRNLFEL